MLQTVEQLLNIRKPDTFAGSVSTVARYFYVKACKFAGITRHTSVRDSSIKLVAHPGCTIAEKLAIVGLYDREAMQYIADHLTPDDVFWDIGANIGPFSILAAQAGATVYSFEPHPVTFGRLVENLEANGIAGTAHQIALTDHCGTVQFADSAGSASNGIVSIGGITVQCSTGDDFAQSRRPPTWVKIDTEGHELAVITGMSGILHGVKYLSFEANGLSSADDLERIRQLLVAAGLRVGLLSDGQLIEMQSLGSKSPKGDYHAIR